MTTTVTRDEVSAYDYEMGAKASVLDEVCLLAGEGTDPMVLWYDPKTGGVELEPERVILALDSASAEDGEGNWAAE